MSDKNKLSVNVQDGTANSIPHNDRFENNKDEDKLLPIDQRLENIKFGDNYSNINKMLKDIRNDVNEKRSALNEEVKKHNKENPEDKKKFIRKLKKNIAVTQEHVLSLPVEIVNLNSVEDIKSAIDDYIKLTEEKYNIKFLTGNWHRDEGHFNIDKKEFEINEHWHGLFTNQDNKHGLTVRSAGGKKKDRENRIKGMDGREMQDDAESCLKHLGFKRGISSVKKLNDYLVEHDIPKEKYDSFSNEEKHQIKKDAGAVRLSSRKYKEQKERETKQKLEKYITELKEELEKSEKDKSKLSQHGLKKSEKIKFLENQLNQTERENKKWAEKYTKQKSAADNNSLVNKAKKGGLSFIKDKLDDSKELKLLRAENKDLSNKVYKLEDNNMKQKNHIKDLEYDKKQLQFTIDNLNRDIEKRGQEIRKTIKDSDLSNEDKKALYSENSTLKKDFFALSKDFKKLKEENTDLLLKYNDVLSAFESIKNKTEVEEHNENQWDTDFTKEDQQETYKEIMEDILPDLEEAPNIDSEIEAKKPKPENSTPNKKYIRNSVDPENTVSTGLSR